MSHHKSRHRNPFDGQQAPEDHVQSNIPMAHHGHPSSRQAPVITVQATVVKYQGEAAAAGDGAMHQHFIILITQVTQVQGADNSIVSMDRNSSGGNCWVAARYGSLTQHDQPVPGLTAGATITIQGEYITLDKARPGPDNPHLPVLHFTHHPVGFIQVGNTRYA